MATWLEAEGHRRTTWLGFENGQAVAMVSLFEYRRMPKPGQPRSAWGYVSNLFVREAFRRRGIAAALLAELVAEASRRHYARLLVAPSHEALPLYRRAGFVWPGEGGGDLLLVRPGGP